MIVPILATLSLIGNQSCASRSESASTTKQRQVVEKSYVGNITPASVSTASVIIPPIYVNLKVKETTSSEEVTDSATISKTSPDVQALVASVSQLATIAATAYIPPALAQPESDLLTACLSGLSGALAGGGAVHLSNRRKKKLDLR